MNIFLYEYILILYFSFLIKFLIFSGKALKFYLQGFFSQQKSVRNFLSFAFQYHCLQQQLYNSKLEENIFLKKTL